MCSHITSRLDEIASVCYVLFFILILIIITIVSTALVIAFVLIVTTIMNRMTLITAPIPMSVKMKIRLNRIMRHLVWWPLFV